MITKALRLFHTVRHLKARQIVWRLLRLLPDWRWIGRRHLETQEVSRPAPGWAKRNPVLLGKELFRFLNETGDLSEGWEPSGKSLLWRYNLHYFDDLNASGSDRRRAWHHHLIDRWIRDNPIGQGSGWAPYPTSLRIVNWVKADLSGLHLSPRALQSLAIQVRWLRRHLEYHLLGNHLFANAKALLFAGSFFRGREASGWRKKALSILQTELREQFLADGGHLERSPMYHAIGLEDLLDLLNLDRAYDETLPVELREQVRRRASLAMRWLTGMSHPDGLISFFNDAAHGIAPGNRELTRYAVSLGVSPDPGPGSRVFCDSGYARLENDVGVAILDIGKIGPDYLPGHAHADTLSFELSVRGKRFIVNSGTSVYGTGPERLRQRGTAAHSTVEVGGENSSEVWAGFRVARRATPFELRTDVQGDAITVECSHDGYRRLRKNPVHKRRWSLTQDGLVVADWVTPPISAIARYHLHPDWRLDVLSENLAIANWRNERIRIRVPNGRAELVASTYHPEFGVSIPSHCLAVHVTGGHAKIEIRF